MSLHTDGRHAATAHYRHLFEFEHLTGQRRVISERVANLAQGMIDSLPDGIELSAGLRKLREAKDCFVNAQVIAEAEQSSGR